MYVLIKMNQFSLQQDNKSESQYMIIMEAINQNSRGDSTIRSSLLGRTSIIPSINPSVLSPQILQTLGDNSSSYMRQKNIYDIVTSFTAKYYMIRPQNKWLLAWHVLIMIILLYYIFEIGLLWGYGEAVWIDELAVFYSLNAAFIIILLIDCFLSNFKAYYSHGLLVTHPRLIVKRYLRVRFYLDIIAIISIAIPFAQQVFALNWIKALFLLKVYQLYQIDQQFVRVSQLNVKFYTTYRIARMIFLMVLGSHYLGIWFYMIDYWVYANNYYGPNTPNLCWIYNAQAYSQIILLLPWYGQYLYTMYFSIATMTTIAYGDITPLNPITAIYITFALIAYIIGYGYTLSEIIRTLMRAQASKFQHTNNLLLMSSMMKNKKVKQKTQSKIKSYFEKIWKQEMFRNRKVQKKLIQQLPRKIRNQLYTLLYETFFSNILLFHLGGERSVRTNFMVAIANQIREHRLVEGHILYKSQQEYDPIALNNHIYYFIKPQKESKTKSSIQIGVKDLVIQSLTEGGVGIEGFYTGDPRDHWAKVIRSVLVYQLPRKILLQNIHLATQTEQQNIFFICETIYNLKCYVCRQGGHNFKKCPFVTYQPNMKQLIFFLIKQNQKDVSSEQLNELRKTKTHYNTLILSRDIKHTKYKIRDKYQLMLTNKYYRKLFSFGKEKHRKKEKYQVQDDLMVKYNERNSSFVVDRLSKKRAYAEEMKAMSKLAQNLTNRGSPKQSPSSGSLFGQIQSFQIQIEPERQRNQRQLSSIMWANFKQEEAYPLTYSNYEKQHSISHNIHRASTLIPMHKLKQSLSKQQDECSSCLTSSSSSTSTESSVDLQNYVKQTQFYIQHLENFQREESQMKHHTLYHDIQFDRVKEYDVYHIDSNISEVIRKYNEANQPKRRKADVIKYNPRKTYSDLGQLSIRGILNETIISEEQRQYSVGQIENERT